MKSKQLNDNASFDDIAKWLNENLSDKDSLIPHLNPIPQIGSKGIYFWFMNPEGYEKLCRYADIKPIYTKFSKTIDGIEYDIVYVGTTGTGKNGNSTLYERLKWHIEQEHNSSNVCHGTLSTLRGGIGTLLAEDLIIPNTEDDVNSFMKKFLKVFWIEYPNNKNLIDSDEKILIKTLKPLLNIKNNPNAKTDAPNNSTRSYKIRRTLIYQNIRRRIPCKNESESERKLNKNTTNSISFNDQIIADDICVEFFVLSNQNISEVIRGIDGLPEGACNFTITDSKNAKIVLFPRWNRTGRNIHINPDAQNIYTYFANNSNRVSRWSLIQNEMLNKGIDEITVRVCPM